MSNRKRQISQELADRTTTNGEGVKITPPTSDPEIKRDQKHYVGFPNGIPSEEEALNMGRALFDAIAKEQAKNARARKD